MAGVVFRGIEKVFPDGTRAVRGLDLEIGDGELMVLVGPSGCGKSTILRLLAGLERPTSGEILVGDEPVQERAPQDRNVAMVFQNYALYPHMSVRGNLEFPLRMAGLPRDERRRRVTAAADLLGLTEQLDRRPRQLSGGQRQRVAMGRAIVREPAAFLMDEPLSNLDAKLRVRIRAEIAALQRRLGTTMIYVTHDQVEAMTMGDRVAVLDEGRMLQLGTPQELYRTPANAFVARFIGSPGMNLLRATLHRGEEGPLLRVGPRQLRGIAPTGAPPGELLLGIRPEAFGPSGDAAPENRLPIDVDAVELLGHDQLVYGRLPGTSILLVARLPLDTEARAGEPLELHFDPAEVHFFAPDGSALS
jgi:multiple sugar transport system ATP-binding protein